MTKNEMLDKAIYIQYPISYLKYRDYKVDRVIHKLPLPKVGMMYDKWKLNENHFTTMYHRMFSLPLLKTILNIEYNEEDFSIIQNKSSQFDISIQYPKNDYKYDIYGFDRNENFSHVSYNSLIENESLNSDITDYHRLYRYSHECSRIVNETIDSKRKLFISGDSQMIPVVPILSCFFKEIWYFDNRKQLILHDKWKEVEFSDVLIELNNNPLEKYVNVNFL